MKSCSGINGIFAKVLLVTVISIFFTSCSPDLSKYSTGATIEMIVNTDGINQQSVSNLVRFVGQNPNSSPKDFETLVLLNEVVEWVGRPETTVPQNQTSIRIKMIERRKGKRVLRGIGNIKSPIANPDVVRARIKGKNKVLNKIQEYNIYFEVYEQGQLTGEYKLDPKLRVVVRRTD